jgi:hypothetical protein
MQGCNFQAEITSVMMLKFTYVYTSGSVNVIRRIAWQKWITWITSRRSLVPLTDTDCKMCLCALLRELAKATINALQNHLYH